MTSFILSDTREDLVKTKDIYFIGSEIFHGNWAWIALVIQGGQAKVRPTYIFDGNIWMHR